MGGLPLTTWLCAKMARHKSALCKNGTRAKIPLTTRLYAKMARHNSALCKNGPLKEALCKNGSPYNIPKPYVGSMSCGEAAPHNLDLCKNGPSQLGSVQKWHSCKKCPHNLALCKNGPSQWFSVVIFPGGSDGTRKRGRAEAPGRRTESAAVATTMLVFQARAVRG